MPILNMIAQGNGGGGGNIGEPLNLTVTTSGLDATITWEDNEIGTIPPTTFQKSELVRKIGSAPTSPSDGTLVVTETVKDTYKTTGYVDQGLTDGETYYYRVFSYSDLGGISYCDAESVTPSGGWTPTWRLDQATNLTTYDSINRNKQGISISSDGNYMYLGISSGYIEQYSLSTPFDTTTATLVTTINGVSGQHGVFISPDGLKLFAVGNENYTVKEYTLQSANNLTGATSVNVTLTRNGGTGICFNSDGTKCIIGRYSGSFMYSLSCPTPYSLVGATEIATKTLGFPTRGISISEDGLHLFVGHDAVMEQWDLTTKDDISTASFAYSYTTTAISQDDYAGTITADGRYFFFITDSQYVHRVDMPGSSGGWQPGANTIAYYPLTSTSTVNDMSGNSNTLTNNSSVTFGVNAGVDCATFYGGNYLSITGLLDYTQLNGCTMCAWFYVVQYPTGSDGKVIATDGSTSIMFAKWLSPFQYYMEIAGGTGTGVTTIGEWTLGMISSDGTNNILALKSSNIDYTNDSITANRSSLGSSFGIGAQPSGNGKMSGYVSNVIIEDKKWSVQDFLDYYNQTKGDYGIS